MSNSIIEVNNLSKSYTISHEGRERYTSLRDEMVQKAKKVFSLFHFVKKRVNHTSKGSVQAPAPRHKGSFFE